MRGILPAGVLAVAILMGCVEPAPAQVFIRAPFTRVYTGGPFGPGTYIRAPFVNLWIPNSRFIPPPGYPFPPPPGYMFGPPGGFPFAPPPPQAVVPQQPAPPPPAPQTPPQEAETPPPPRVAPNGPVNLTDFAKSFQARAGNFEVTFLNPVSKKATTVRFTLPEGTPKQILVRAEEIEFVYGSGRFVRIQFDQDGATVVSRG